MYKNPNFFYACVCKSSKNWIHYINHLVSCLFSCYILWPSNLVNNYIYTQNYSFLKNYFWDYTDYSVYFLNQPLLKYIEQLKIPHNPVPPRVNINLVYVAFQTIFCIYANISITILFFYKIRSYYTYCSATCILPLRYFRHFPVSIHLKYLHIIM